MNSENRKYESSQSETSIQYRVSGVTDEQRDRSRQALETFMAALKAQNQKDVQQAKTLPIWCKHCGHEASLAGAKVNKEEECFQLLCPRCRELLLQIRTRNTTALGALARMFPSFQDSVQAHSASAEQIEHCLWAFQKHDFKRCLDLAASLEPDVTQSYLVQILIICAQRLGLNGLVEQMGQMALVPTANHSPWETVLLKLTLGLTGFDEAMKAARSDSDRCRVLFYRAARLLTLGDKKEAKQMLKECLRFEIEWPEKTLAHAEMELT